jgi:NIMA (never in mitosis gene a)-related kinase
MEFAEGGDILKRIQAHNKARSKHKEQEVWRALVHMTLGLKSLH